MTSTAVLTYMKLIQFGIFWVLLLITLPNIYNLTGKEVVKLPLHFLSLNIVKFLKIYFKCNANMKNICLSISEVNNSYTKWGTGN